MRTNKLLTLLAVATLPFLAACVSEAERARRAAEQAKRIKIEHANALKAFDASEKKMIRENLQIQIFPAEQKLSEEERSRGWTLLETFGDEQMPILTEKCRTARRNYLEAEANLKELVAALKAENPNFNANTDADKHYRRRHRRTEEKQTVNPVYDAAQNRMLDLAAEYWWLRYKLTDFYSQFKIGAITSDKLAERDTEFAEK